MRRILISCLAVACIAATGIFLADSLDAGEKGKKKVELKVKIGENAPGFESIDEDGKPVKSADFVGKQVVVLFFYPADFTGG